MTRSGTPSTARMTDWLARQTPGGVIDFRLPEDGEHIPRPVIYARIAEYYRQVRAQRPPPKPGPKTANNTRPGQKLLL